VQKGEKNQVIVRTLKKSCVFLKHYIAELLVSFEQLPVSIVKVYRSKILCRDIVVLRVSGKTLTLSINLQELVERRDILSHLHPLESTLVRLLAEEERRLCGNLRNLAVWRSGLLGVNDLAQFACIEQSFRCSRTAREMVIMAMPGQDQHQCLSVRDLLNDRETMMLLKSLTAYSYKTITTDWTEDQIVVC